MMSPRRSFAALGLIAVSALSLVACSSGSSSNGMLQPAGTGRIQILMASGSTGMAATTGTSPTRQTLGNATTGLSATAHDTCDGTLQNLKSANVTLSSILARTLDGKLVPVTIDLPTTIDLLSLGTGNDVTLPVGFLPAGTYDQLVVVITKLDLVLTSGATVDITPPGGGWTAIVRVTQPFTVADGKTTTVTVKFRPEMSFGCGGDGGWLFHPQFDCDGGHD